MVRANDFDSRVDLFHTMQTQSEFQVALRAVAGEVLRDARSSAPILVDLGSGPGGLPRLALSRSRIPGADEMVPIALGVALDTSFAMCQRANVLGGGVRAVCADAMSLPFRSGSIDVVTATNCLFLLPDPRAGAREIARILKPGGRFVTVNPTDRNRPIEMKRWLAIQRLGAPSPQIFEGWSHAAESHDAPAAGTIALWLGEAGLELRAMRLLFDGLASLVVAARSPDAIVEPAREAAPHRIPLTSVSREATKTGSAKKQSAKKRPE